MNGVMKEVKMGMRRRKESKRLPALLYADDLVLCGESEEELRTVVGHFIEVCRRTSLKVYEGKSKVMLLGGRRG